MSLHAKKPKDARCALDPNLKAWPWGKIKVHDGVEAALLHWHRAASRQRIKR